MLSALKDIAGRMEESLEVTISPLSPISTIATTGSDSILLSLRASFRKGGSSSSPKIEEQSVISNTQATEAVAVMEEVEAVKVEEQAVEKVIVEEGDLTVVTESAAPVDSITEEDTIPDEEVELVKEEEAVPVIAESSLEKVVELDEAVPEPAVVDAIVPSVFQSEGQLFLSCRRMKLMKWFLRIGQTSTIKSYIRPNNRSSITVSY